MPATLQGVRSELPPLEPRFPEPVKSEVVLWLESDSPDYLEWRGSFCRYIRHSGGAEYESDDSDVLTWRLDFGSVKEDSLSGWEGAMVVADNEERHLITTLMTAYDATFTPHIPPDSV